MTSVFPPAAVPGPDDEQGWQHPDDQQPDPFGDDTDDEGGKVDENPADPQERSKSDPRGQ